MSYSEEVDVYRIGFFPKSRRGSRWIRVELSQEYGSDPASTLEGIQLDETAGELWGLNEEGCGVEWCGEREMGGRRVVKQAGALGLVVDGGSQSGLG